MRHDAERRSRTGQGAAINRDEFTSDLRLEILLHRRIFLQPPSLRSCLCSGCHTWLANVWQPLRIQPQRGYAGCFLLALWRLFYPQLSTVSRILVFLNTTSPVAAADSPLQLQLLPFPSFSRRRRVSVSPEQDSGSLLYIFAPSLFSPRRGFCPDQYGETGNISIRSFPL